VTLPVPATAPAVITPEDPLMARSPVTLHMPPPVASVNVSIAPAQILTAPFIGVAVATVTIVVAVQPVTEIKEMVAVPVDRPFTIPFVEPTVATLVLLLLQFPAPAVSVSVVPVHILPLLPVMFGKAITLTIVVASHPSVIT